MPVFDTLKQNTRRAEKVMLEGRGSLDCSQTKSRLGILTLTDCCILPELLDKVQ